MVGPSARGSLKGTPNSITSAPAVYQSSQQWNGLLYRRKPAVRYGITPGVPLLRISWKLSLSLSTYLAPPMLAVCCGSAVCRCEYNTPSPGQATQ